MSGPRVFFILIVVGAVARAAAAVLTTNSPDLALFAYFVRQGALGHTLYADPAGFVYPPLVGYCWIGFGKLLAALGQPAVVHIASLSPYRVAGLVTADLTPPLASALIKTPALCADAGAAWCVDAVCRRLLVAPARRRAAVLAFWLNPMVVFDSAVQASWDAVVPLAVIAAFAAACDRKAFSSGAWIVLGTFAKLTPLLCAPLALVAAVRAHSRPDALRAVLYWCAGGVALATLALLPAAAWHELGDVGASVAAHTGVTIFGAFNLWAIASISALAPFDRWLYANGAHVANLLFALQVGGVMAVAFAAASDRAPTLERRLLAALATLAAVLLTVPYLQPGYVVWLLPPCCVMCALRPRPWAALTAVVSLAAFAFTMAIRSPAALVMPACVFFHWCDAQPLARTAYGYAYHAGTFTPLLQLDLDLVFGVVGFLAIVWIFAACIRDWRGRAVSDV